MRDHECDAIALGRDLPETLATLNIDEEDEDTITAPSWKVLDFAEEETWIEGNGNDYGP